MAPEALPCVLRGRSCLASGGAVGLPTSQPRTRSFLFLYFYFILKNASCDSLVNVLNENGLTHVWGGTEQICPRLGPSCLFPAALATLSALVAWLPPCKVPWEALSTAHAHPLPGASVALLTVIPHATLQSRQFPGKL